MEPPRVPIKAPIKPPLITPSASPPPLRTEMRYTRPESAPPYKRQRTSSTPRPTPNPSTSIDPIDVDKERRASTMRLLDFWDSLASYTRALDDDDIVDVMTGKITRDNGVLRKSDKITFGGLHAPSAECATSDEGSDNEENEYDDDELDAFATDDGPTLALEATGIIPPVTPLDPADADDLRQFMEAEEKRRELCGTDVEEEEDIDAEKDREEYFERDDDITRDQSFRDRHLTHQRSTTEEEEEEEEEGEHDNGVLGTYGHYSDYVVPLNSGSDDELDNWGVDDASVIHPVLKAESEVVNPVNKEIVKDDAAAKNDARKDTLPRTPSKSRQLKPPKQLNTPPQSSSSALSITLTDPNFIDLSEDTPSPPSSPRAESPLTYSPNRRPTSPTKSPQDSISRPSLKSSSNNHSYQESTSHSVFKPNKNMQQVKSTPKKAGPTKMRSISRTPQHTAYVLLTPRKSSSPQKVPSSSGDDAQSKASQSSPTKPWKGKGKMKQPDDAPELRKSKPGTKIQSPQKKRLATREYSPDDNSDRSDASPPSSPTKFFRTQTPRREAYTENSRCAPENTQFLSPTFPSPPIRRKRKRRLSDADMLPLDAELETDQPPVGVDIYHPPTILSRVASSSNDDIRSKRDLPRNKYSPRWRRTPESESGDESSSSNDTNDHTRHRSHSRAPSHYPYPPYPAPPPGYTPIPDPRAQLIITQAMQQLSALVGAPWIHPHQYFGDAVPQTPSHRHHSRPANSTFMTPTHHPHPYPYSYNPELSRATLPPDSPETSSPEKPAEPRRKSLVRRSRSRGRNVSFYIEENVRGIHSEISYSSPSAKRSLKGGVTNMDRDWDHEERPKSSRERGKGKGREQTPYVSALAYADDPPSESDDNRGRSTHTRGQTPGPSFGSMTGKERSKPSSRSRKEDMLRGPKGG